MMTEREMVAEARAEARRRAVEAVARWVGGDDFDADPGLYFEQAEALLRSPVGEHPRSNSMTTLHEEIAAVLNKHSAENASNTPDFILAGFLMDCLAAFDQATQQRETWYGRDASPTSVVPPGSAAGEEERDG